MSVGFFVALGPAGLIDQKIHAAFVGHTPWGMDGQNREIDIRGDNWRIICMNEKDPDKSRIWKEPSTHDNLASFVYIQGWCYRISAASESLADGDYLQILERFRAGLPPFSEDFGGQFVAVIYDPRRRRLAIQPDRLALGGSFYAQADGEFAASNRALRLANYFGSALDGHSVLAQMRGTHMPFGRTLFAGVQRMMGATYLDFDLEKGAATVRKQDSLFVPTREISYADSVELVTNAVRTTVSRLLAASPVRFDLTGGNDTRVIASAVENLSRGNGNGNFIFRVADPEDSPDVRIARRVADSCGWQLFRADRNHQQQATMDELARAATGGDGNFALNQVWERVYSERVFDSEGRWRTHVGAPAGEVFRGYFYAQEMLSLGRSSKVNYDALLDYRTYASRGVELGVFGPSHPTFEENDEALLAPYRAIGNEGGSLPNVNKLDIMYLQRHCYRSGNAVSWLSGYLNIRLPFLSWELAGLGLSLPWKYRANRGLMQRVIGKLSPKLAGIPNEDGEPMKPLSLTTLPSYIAAEIPIVTSRAGRVIRRALGRSGGLTVSGLPAPQDAYFSVLDNAKSVPGIFDPAVIRQLRAAVASPQNPRASLTTFYVLCTIEMLLQEAPALRHELVFN